MQTIYESEQRYYTKDKAEVTYMVFGICRMEAKEIALLILGSVMAVTALWAFIWLIYAFYFAIGIIS